MGRVPGCGRRGEAHRGNGHGGAPTAAGKRARDGGDLWRRCSGVRAARERWKRGLLERKWGRGRGRVGLRAQVARGGAVASSTRDVGAEKAGARSSGGGYARKTGLTARAREQRESEGASARGESGRRQVGPGEQRENGAGARKAGAPTGGARCAERGGEGGARARDGPAGPKGRGGGWVGLLYLFLLF